MLAGTDDVPVRVHLSSDELDYELDAVYASGWLRDCPGDLSPIFATPPRT